MKNSFGDMFKQAQKVQDDMQKKIQDLQDELANMEAIGESGAGMVKISMNGRYDVKQVKIDPDLLKEEVQILEDLLAAAINDAVQKVEKNKQSKLGPLGAGLNIADSFNIFKR